MRISVPRTRKPTPYLETGLLAATAVVTLLVACDTEPNVTDSKFLDASAGGTEDAQVLPAPVGTFQEMDGASAPRDASFDPDSACASVNVAAKRIPANVLFIVDRSGSMGCNPPPTTDSATCEAFPTAADPTAPTKWSITRDALKAAVAALPPDASVAITFFNTDDDCGAKSQPDVAMGALVPDQRLAIDAALDTVTPKGSTPIVGGVTLGYHYLATSPLVGRKYLVLLTDGQETCAPDQQATFVSEDGFVAGQSAVHTTVANAALVGIRTFVIGAPGSEGSRAFLSQIAHTGGTASSAACLHASAPADVGDCHFDLTTSGSNLAKGLADALEAIGREAIGCELDVPTPETATVDPDEVNVVYTPSGDTPRTIPQDSTVPCDVARGWQYSADKKKIVLCGATCATVRQDPGAKLQVAFGCKTEVR
jgi:hypothetical protein